VCNFFGQKFAFVEVSFWAIFGQNWALFHKTSGHTGNDDNDGGRFDRGSSTKTESVFFSLRKAGLPDFS
jgi:hypothetical protein